MIEIAKSLLSDGEVIIMDEPTATLTEREIEVLFRIIQNLKQKNVAIIYISHRMWKKSSKSVTASRSCVTVYPLIRNEQLTLATMKWCVKWSAGTLRIIIRAEDLQNRTHRFEAKKLSSERKFQDVSFQVKAGEIVGFSGLMGAGRTEIMRSIFGIDPLGQW